MEIAFRRLPDIPPRDLVALMNHPSLRRHLPLLRDAFTATDAARFVAAKEALWAEHGYGPWAIVVDGTFVGWGGLQPENGDPDLALVLHPDHWGLGAPISRRIIAEAFERWHFESVTALLPPSRIRRGAMQRLGFVPDGGIELHGERFLRFRLHGPTGRGDEYLSGPSPRSRTMRTIRETARQFLDACETGKG